MNRERGRGIVIYVHTPGNPLLEHHLFKTLRELATLEERPIYVWSNRSGRRFGQPSWLHAKVQVNERKKTYTAREGSTFTWQLELSTGYTVSMEVTSLVDAATSWDVVTRLELPVELPDEMTYRSTDTSFPAYVEARARQLATESAAAALREQVGTLRIHPEKEADLIRPDAPLDLALLRAQAAHAPDLFQQDVSRILNSGEPQQVSALIQVLAAQPSVALPPEAVTRLAGLDASVLDATAEALFPLRDLGNPAVVIPLIAQMEGQTRNRIISQLSFSEPEVRDAAMPFADGVLPSKSAARQSLAGYLINFSDRDPDIKTAWLRSKQSWLEDEDVLFASRVADRMLSQSPEVAGELILASLSMDARSAAVLARVGRFAQTPSGLAINRKGYDLIPLAEGDAQKRLATRLPYSAGDHAEDWHKVFAIAQDPRVSEENRQKIYSTLKRKWSVVDELARQNLTQAMGR